MGRNSSANLIPTDPLVDLLVFDQMRLLPERFPAHFTPERFLACMRSEVHLDVTFIQETSVADGTPVHGLLLTADQTRFRSVR